MSHGGYSHGQARKDTEEALSERRPFRRFGFKMWAREGYDRLTFGGLSTEWIDQLREDDPTYTVYSYGTPIAWVTRGGVVRQPPVKYSPTTTQHQHTCQYHLR
jgi:hypothetical protein